MTITVDDIFNAAPVIPVLAFKSEQEALETCSFLYDAGVRVFEITLRHKTALAGLKAVADHLPKDAMVGAGTIMTPDDLDCAVKAGAGFGISPGLTPALAQAIRQTNLPFLPGVASISEAMQAREYGFKALKFFPAAASGGTDFLKAAGSVLPDVQFCPTGGINLSNKESYLALSNVPVVGGSWLIERDTDGAIDKTETLKQLNNIF